MHTPENTCCFTGHRILAMPEWQLEKRTLALIEKAIEKGYRHFICGGALGFDMIAAEQIMIARTLKYEDITLEIAIPCIDQSKNWLQNKKARYEVLLEIADKITYISDKEYTRSCMQDRNRYMVNKSTLCIAYCTTNRPSGTKSTIYYAKKVNCDVLLVPVL